MSKSLLEAVKKGDLEFIKNYNPTYYYNYGYLDEAFSYASDNNKREILLELLKNRRIFPDQESQSIYSLGIKERFISPKMQTKVCKKYLELKDYEIIDAFISLNELSETFYLSMCEHAIENKEISYFKKFYTKLCTVNRPFYYGFIETLNDIIFKILTLESEHKNEIIDIIFSEKHHSYTYENIITKAIESNNAYIIKRLIEHKINENENIKIGYYDLLIAAIQINDDLSFGLLFEKNKENLTPLELGTMLYTTVVIDNKVFYDKIYNFIDLQKIPFDRDFAESLIYRAAISENIELFKDILNNLKPEKLSLYDLLDNFISSFVEKGLTINLSKNHAEIAIISMKYIQEQQIEIDTLPSTTLKIILNSSSPRILDFAIKSNFLDDFAAEDKMEIFKVYSHPPHSKTRLDLERYTFERYPFITNIKNSDELFDILINNEQFMSGIDTDSKITVLKNLSFERKRENQVYPCNAFKSLFSKLQPDEVAKLDITDKKTIFIFFAKRKDNEIIQMLYQSKEFMNGLDKNFGSALVHYFSNIDNDLKKNLILQFMADVKDGENVSPELTIKKDKEKHLETTK